MPYAFGFFARLILWDPSHGWCRVSPSYGTQLLRVSFENFRTIGELFLNHLKDPSDNSERPRHHNSRNALSVLVDPASTIVRCPLTPSGVSFIQCSESCPCSDVRPYDWPPENMSRPARRP